jgi:hypothetical protein
LLQTFAVIAVVVATSCCVLCHADDTYPYFVVNTLSYTLLEVTFLLPLVAANVLALLCI